MALTNYRDISPASGDVGAGFQFEFNCESCGDTWKSPFKPYRAGQMTGLLRRFTYVFGEFYRVGAITDMMGKVQRAVVRRCGRRVPSRSRPRSRKRWRWLPTVITSAPIATRRSATTAGMKPTSSASSAKRSRASAIRPKVVGRRRAQPLAPTARRRRKEAASVTNAGSTWRARTRAVPSCARPCPVRRVSAPMRPRFLSPTTEPHPMSDARTDPLRRPCAPATRRQRSST